MINDEPMTRDELIAAFAQLTDPEWPATIPTYRENQHKRYREAMALGWQDTAQDALWRAASEADMLTQAEHSHTELTPARVTELITLLGWS
jgi:hypothetical protein